MATLPPQNQVQSGALGWLDEANGPSSNRVRRSERGTPLLSKDDAIDLAGVVGLIFLLIAVARVTSRLHHVVDVLVLATAFAFTTAPLRSRLARRVSPGLASAAVAIVSFAGLTGLASVLVRDLQRQSERLGAVLLGAIDGLREGTLPARVAEVVHARDGVNSVFGRLATTVVAGENDVAGIGNQVADLFIVIVLAAFLQGAGPRLRDWLIARWPRSERARVRRRWQRVEQRAGALARTSLTVAFATAVAIAVVAHALGLEGALLIGAWAGLWAPVPAVGLVIALAPLGATCLAQERLHPALVAVGCIALAVPVSAVRRRVDRRAEIRAGASPWVLGLAAGFALGGLAGMFVALTFLAFALSALARHPASDDIDEAGSDTSGSSQAEAEAIPTVEALFVRPGGKEWWRTVLTWRGAAVLSATVAVATLAWMMLNQVGALVVWAVVAVLLAVALDRPVGALCRRFRAARGIAVIAVLLAVLLVMAAIVLLAVRGSTDSARDFRNDLPKAVEQLEGLPGIGGVLEDRNASEWVRDQVDNLPRRFSGSPGLAEWLPTIGGRMVDLFWTLLIGVSLLLDGPRLTAAVARRLPVRSRRQFRTVAAVTHQVIGGYLGGAATVALLNALVVLVTATVPGIALVPVLAAWAFLCNFVPQIGGFLGGFPFVVLAMAAGPTQALIAAVVFLSYQFTENHLIQPAIIGKAVDVPPIVALLAALAGGAAGGLVGAIVLTPVIGVVKVIVETYRRDDFPGRTAASAMAAAEAESPQRPNHGAVGTTDV